MNFAKFLRTPFFIEHFWWLLLEKTKLHNGILGGLLTCFDNLFLASISLKKQHVILVQV